MTALLVTPGNVVRCHVVFTDATGGPAAPTTVVFRLRPATGAEQQPPVTPDITTGAYYVLVPVADVLGADGQWHWRWEGTGAVVAAAEGWFTVLPSPFATAAP